MNTVALAKKIRINALRMTCLGGSSHIGSIFSMTDILAVLYGEIMQIDPKNPKWSKRDRFVLSKGHSGAGVYAALAESGFFDPDILKEHYQDGSILSGHISHKGVPGVELSTGSLGHGLSVGSGMAYCAKIDELQHKVYVLMSDGECDEGSNWEAILFSAHHKLDNLVAIVDYNKLQSLCSVAETLGLEPFADKWRSFGWHVEECDGHDHVALKEVLVGAPSNIGRPTCIIANTVKGKGVSFMENNILWHYRCPKGDEFESALRELNETE